MTRNSNVKELLEQLTGQVFHRQGMPRVSQIKLVFSLRWRQLTQKEQLGLFPRGVTKVGHISSARNLIPPNCGFSFLLAECRTSIERLTVASQSFVRFVLVPLRSCNSFADPTAFRLKASPSFFSGISISFLVFFSTMSIGLKKTAAGGTQGLFCINRLIKPFVVNFVESF